MQCIENSVQMKELLKVVYSCENLSEFDKLITHIIEDLGNALAKMHNSDIIHGDLTTSNMLVTVK